MLLRDFDCQAYGPTVPHCFFELAASPCASRAQCEARMGPERERVWLQLVELARTETWARELVQELPGPEALLGGPAAVFDEDD